MRISRIEPSTSGTHAFLDLIGEYRAGESQDQCLRPAHFDLIVEFAVAQDERALDLAADVEFDPADAGRALRALLPGRVVLLGARQQGQREQDRQGAANSRESSHVWTLTDPC